MSTDSSPIFTAALSLPEPLRSELADQLLLSLAPPQKMLDIEWCDELRKRIAEAESGEIETVSSEEALADLRARLERRERR